VIICLSAMFGWFMGSLDYSQAYLNADLDELCVISFFMEKNITGA
jgi:hypothetical protein